MQTVLKKIVTKFNREFDKQKFLDWFNDSKKILLSEEKEQIKNAFNEGYRQGFRDAQHVTENEKDISEYEDANVYYKSVYGAVD